MQRDQGKDFAFAGEPITDKSIIGNDVAIGIRKNDTALRDKINAAIVALRQSSEYDRISKKYFAYDVYGK
ncbi:Lysine/arginine/ornithine-binding periplasmic protein [Pseudomonas sp. MM227]|uniref:transporter substrate-binding domain-containing protein n=1 Tax=Pseudomonas sp. MM227 TaxID=3019968 RepID=UPI00221F5235|nr:transporter substrate-binding domain-containing protein [Pseudomonas sp. MM227]CAI3788432.1 Lysine/arginine/ornithine-binding periplasmic protein [Pseudomonas sp. MM227]